MIRSVFAFGAPLLALLAVLASTPAGAQQTPPTEEQMRIARAVAAASVPGPEHQRLEALEGRWAQRAVLRSGPGGDSLVVEGRTENRMVLDGRFLESRGRLQGDAGWESLIVLGFDRRWSEYTLVGFDTWGTYGVTASGPWSEREGALLLEGEDHDPVTARVQRYHYVFRMPDPDRYVVEVTFTDPAHTGGGPPLTVLRVEHRRLADGPVPGSDSPSPLPNRTGVHDVRP